MSVAPHPNFVHNNSYYEKSWEELSRTNYVWIPCTFGFLTRRQAHIWDCFQTLFHTVI